MGALLFDGVDDYLIRTASMPVTGHPLTFGAWGRKTGMPLQGTVVAISQGTTGAMRRLSLEFRGVSGGGTEYVQALAADAFGNAEGATSSGAMADAWHSGIAVHGTGRNDRRAFRDGTGKATNTTQLNANWITFDNALYVGRNAQAGSYCNGHLGYAFVWSSELTDLEVAAWQAGDIIAAKLVAAWDFTVAPVGGVYVDQTGNGYDLTVNGATFDSGQSYTGQTYTFGGAQQIAVGLASEEDAADDVSSEKHVPVTVSAEEDTAAAVGASLAATVTVAAEEDTALAVTAEKQAAVGVAAEEDTAPAVAAASQVPVSVAQEEDAAVGVSAALAAAVGQAEELDTAPDVESGVDQPVGVAVEEDTAAGVGAEKLAAVGRAAEDDTAEDVGAALAAPVTVAAEEDAAQTVGAIRAAAVGVAAEEDLAPPVSFEGALQVPVGVATEEDTAPPVGVFEPPVPSGTGSGQMIPVTRVRRQLVPVDQAMELDHALLIRAAIRPSEEEEIARLILLDLL
jgi:hypothetical protein